MWQLILGSTLFVGWHLGVSSTKLRPLLVGWLGEKLFSALYSLITLGILIFMIHSYVSVPHTHILWQSPPVLRWVPLLVMPFSLVLMVGSLMSRNPTLVGMESLARDFGEGSGMIRITRHGFMWAAWSWSVAHLITNGDLASLVFFSGFALLSLLGTFLLDRKKAVVLGENWQHFARVTSNLPFGAILGGRNRLVLEELYLPIAVGLMAYVVLLWGHVWVAGVSLF